MESLPASPIYEAPVRKVIVQASAPQRRFLDEILNPKPDTSVVGLGGARGPGKSWASGTAGVLTCLKYNNVVVLLLRRGTAAVIRNYKTQIMALLSDMRLPDAAQWVERDRKFRFLRTGSEILLGYLDSDRDYEQYQGVEYTRIGLEEASQHLAERWDFLSASLRTTNLKCQPLRWITTNPGGVGHQWVKERFVNEETRWPGHVWIPCTIWSNPATLIKNPYYIRNVLGPLPAWKRQQWLHGDWDAIAGNYFDVPPFIITEVEVPRHAQWYGGVDWGRAAPFAVLWCVTWREMVARPGRTDYGTRDRMHVVAEVYERGLALDEQAMRVKAMERTLEGMYGVGSRDIIYYADWSVDAPMEGEAEEQGRTKARVWRDNGFDVIGAKRTSVTAGWELLRLLMRPAGREPGILTISPRCKALLGEFTNASYDSEGSGDERMSEACPHHALDALRYVAERVYGLEYVAEPGDYRSASEREFARIPESELKVSDILKAIQHSTRVRR